MNNVAINLYYFKQTADSDTVLTYQVFSVQLVTDHKLEALNKAYLIGRNSVTVCSLLKVNCWPLVLL